MQALTALIPDDPDNPRQIVSGTPTDATTSASAPAVKQPPGRLRRLWEAMTGIYGEKWPRAYGDSPQDDDGELTPTGKTWAHGLAGMTGAQIGAGLEACMVSASPWVPTLPEFRAMCVGIPALSLIQLEFRDLAPRSPFGLAVWQLIDADRWRMGNGERRDHLITCAYELTREHVLRGGDLPELPAATLEAPKPAPPKSDPVARERAIREAERLVRGMRDGKSAAAGDA